MIKQIIFDLDNTLIDWLITYYPFSVNNTCNDLNLSSKYDKILEIVIQSIENYENNYEYFTMENLVKELNSNGNSEIVFTDIFAEKLLYYFSECVPEVADSKLINTLDYLKSKYELVVLTNWFTQYQVKRLKKLGILHYFSNVYGTENIKNKPNKEAFLTAARNYNLNECMMIGDNYEKDVLGALNVGMKAIFYNRKKIIVDKNIVCINKFEDLIELL